MTRPPNSVDLASFQEISDQFTLYANGPCVVIVENFQAYIGGPDALARSAIVVLNAQAMDGAPTVWEAHVDIGGDGQPRYFSETTRRVFVIQSDGLQPYMRVVATTGTWDFSCCGFILNGQPNQVPSFSEP